MNLNCASETFVQKYVILSVQPYTYTIIDQ